MHHGVRNVVPARHPRRRAARRSRASIHPPATQRAAPACPSSSCRRTVAMAAIRKGPATMRTTCRTESTWTPARDIAIPGIAAAPSRLGRRHERGPPGMRARRTEQCARGRDEEEQRNESMHADLLGTRSHDHVVKADRPSSTPRHEHARRLSRNVPLYRRNRIESACFHDTGYRGIPSRRFFVGTSIRTQSEARRIRSGAVDRHDANSARAFRF